MKTGKFLRLLLVAVLFGSAAAHGQSKGAPMKNSSVISMVKGGLPDGTILSIMATSNTQFDVSAAGQAALKESGVSQTVINAMVAAEGRKSAVAPVAGAPTPARPGVAKAAAPAALPPEPYVLFGEGGERGNLAADQAQVAVIKSNKKDLGALAAEGALTQALQSAAQNATAQAAGSLGASTSSSLSSTAGALAGGLLQRRAPNVTFLWGLAGKPPTEIPAAQAQRFEVAFAAVPGINVADFAPVLVRLVLAQNNWRLVGATQAKEEAAQSMMPEWELYERFLEEKIPATANQTAPGKFEIKPATALGPGEYAIVLRPAAKNKRFAGAQVMGSLGEGQLFNQAWRFTVKP